MLGSVRDVASSGASAVRSGASKVRSGLSETVGGVRSGLSEIESGVRGGVSDAWGTTQQGLRNISGYDSLNQLATEGLLTGGVLPMARHTGAMAGNVMQQLFGHPEQPQGGAAMGGPMMQDPNMGPGGMTFGSAGGGQGGDPRGIGQIMGAGGERAGEGSPSVSASLLQAAPEAYQIQPLFPEA